MAGNCDSSDQDLVRAALADTRAYAGIIRRYEPRLKRYVGRLLGRNRAETDDVLQEIFLKAYINLNDYDESRAFSPWIYRIAHNEAVSHIRKQRSQPAMINGEDGRLLLAAVMDGSDPQRFLDEARTEKRLHEALSSLEARYRDAMVLRFLEERSYEDIADILGIPMGTVATLINRGKKKLRQAYDALVRE